MRTSDLIRCVYTGQSLVPDGNYSTAQLADRLGEGEVVAVDLDPDRSSKSHRHAFAFVGQAWYNLPENLRGAPYAVSALTLRKHALIATGHCDVSMIALGSESRAERVAAFVDQTARRLSGYAITTVEGPVVYCSTPHSQSNAAMGAETFQKSKQDILEWLADLIGVEPEELAKMGQKVSI